VTLAYIKQEKKILPGTSASNGKYKRSRPGGTALEKCTGLSQVKPVQASNASHIMEIL
jgi:hypothetical protein